MEFRNLSDAFFVWQERLHYKTKPLRLVTVLMMPFAVTLIALP